MEHRDGVRYYSAMDASAGRLTNAALTPVDERLKDSGSEQRDENDSDQSGSEKMETSCHELSELTPDGTSEVFGNSTNRANGSGQVNGNALTKHNDQLNHTQENGIGKEQVLKDTDSRCDTIFQQTGNSDSSSCRPIKKRYAHEETGFSSPAAIVQTPISDPLSFPSIRHYQHAMNQWDWATVDSTKVPVILRGNEKFAAVHMVQLKLLSKFPPIYPPESQNPPLLSHKMSVVESWILNSINAVICKFEYGYQLFTADDELVRLVDVERFYWCVKVFNLNRMIEQYNRHVKTIPKSLYLNATISRVKDYVGADLQVTSSCYSYNLI